MFYNDDDFHDKETDHKRAGVVLAVISFMFLAILAIIHYRDTSDKIFGVKSFYEGTSKESIDPKTQYNNIYKNVAAENATCETVMKVAKNPKIAGKNTVWLVDGKTVKSKKELKKFAVGKNLAKIKPFKDGDMIVSPAELKFINSNVVQYSKDSIVIKAQIGSKYIIEFNDVRTWWCHIGKNKVDRHTEVVGKGGINQKCVEGFIIGEAKDSTTVMLYEIKGGTETPCNFTKLYTLK